jgi:pyridoxal phosphate-dependent aminotransferase EpsN
MKKIYLSPPHMSGNEMQYINDAFTTNWIAPTGPNCDLFENKIKEYVGSKNAIAVSSGTAAIHLALKAVGVTEGDHVLCSTLTFVGTVNPILYEKAIPVLIDSELESWGMDPVLAETAILNLIASGNKPKAILLVHIFGIPANVEAFLKLSEHYDIPLIEDAAESLGSTYHSQHTGTFGRIGIYSFNGNKILSTSGGGMIITDDDMMANYMRYLSTQAKDTLPYYQHREIGYNYRMSNVLAGIGVAQIDVLEERVKRRRQINERYRNELSDYFISFLTERETDRANMWLTCGLSNGSFDPLQMVEHLDKHGIEARPIWKPMHQQPVLLDYPKYINGTSDAIFTCGICLPSGSSMTDKDQTKVINTIKKFKKI